MRKALKKYARRSLGFLAVPCVGVLLAFLAWPLAYPVAYFFFPFLGYGESNTGVPGILGIPTIFSEQQYGWHFSFVYLLLLTALAVWATRRLTVVRALPIFALCFFLGAMAVHGSMYLLGYHYYVETP